MEIITGNKFKKICHYSLDEFGFVKHSEPKENEILRIFSRIDHVYKLFNIKIDRHYELVTHNGDTPVDDRFSSNFDDPNLLIWYGQNINTRHPKLKSIPIGLANEIWPHGDEYVFRRVIDQNFKKERLLYANFDVNTNQKERNLCLSELRKYNLDISQKLSFEKYCEELAKSYFVVSPNGNGIDCHKTWEALYLKTIPIVTKSINIEYYSKEFPIMIIDGWENFNPQDCSEIAYSKIWNNFNISKLTIKNFIK